MIDIAITIIAHVPDERAEAPTLLPADVTNDMVDTLSRHGVIVDEVNVSTPDDDVFGGSPLADATAASVAAREDDPDGLVVYCFCGHEEASHTPVDIPGGWCDGCGNDPEHDVDPRHGFRAAS